MKKMQRNSPSNIRTGWNQKYFYKLEWDAMLDTLIELFAQNGNNWSMNLKAFNKLVSEKQIDQHFSFVKVRDQVMEIEGETIGFMEFVAETLLSHNWKWSFRNSLKNFHQTSFAKMCADAWAFISSPEARKVSEFHYPSGSPMSIRDAKKSGLIK